MQYTMPTDEDFIAAAPAVRRWWGRVYRLINDTACTLEQAILAVQAADKEITHEHVVNA